ncbi:16S rRNA (guanine(527)-N(7))-methyltransferase RsmG [Natronospora cellulosivora (SeqCode)]
MNKKDFAEILNKGLENMGLNTSDKLEDQLYLYLQFLIEENKKYNLTAIEEEEEVIRKHFLDSLVLFKKINIKEEASIIDIGTGAGFPGLVLKIYRPDLKILLLDSLAKRVRFLNTLINKLNLEGIEAVHGRAEDIADDKSHRENYDLAVSRAVAPINILSEYTIPFVMTGGSIVFYKGPDYQAELEEGKNAINILGGDVSDIYNVEIPKLIGERFLIIIDKIRDTASKYPRRTGIPKKRPL